MKSLWTAPPIWKGEQCIVIGGGASIPKQFDIPQEVVQSVFSGSSTPAAYSPYMEAIHKESIIAVNMAYTLGNWVDVLFFGDGAMLKKKGVNIFDFQGLKVSCATAILPYHKKIKILNRSTKTMGIDFDPNFICWNLNSGAGAINLAVHFGVKRILLLGFDMNLTDGKDQHFHKYYGGNPKTVVGVFKRHMKGFAKIAADLKGQVEVINCNPDSAIVDFPKAHIKEFL